MNGESPFANWLKLLTQKNSRAGCAMSSSKTSKEHSYMFKGYALLNMTKLLSRQPLMLSLMNREKG